MALSSLVVILFGFAVAAHARDQSSQAPPSYDVGIDREIEDAAGTSAALDFLQNNETVLVEMDIMYTRDDWEFIQKYGVAGQENKPIEKRDLDRAKRKGIANRRWPQNTVPYEFRSGFSSRDRSTIDAAINDYHKYTCIKFKRAGRERGKIYFTNGGGCSSYVGTTGGSQPVTLARGCRTKGIVIHELGHAVGLNHEQTRPDRDNYVVIHTRNIQKSTLFNFQKYNRRVIPDWGVEYDYHSVMHYSSHAFSTNGRATITAKDPKYTRSLGNRRGFSFRDIKMINIMYKCASQCPEKRCPGEGFVGKDCNCWCPGSSNSDPVKQCSGTTIVTGGKGGKGGGKGECKEVNKHERCEEWKKRGECDGDHKFYMHRNCRKACFCKDTEGTGCTTVAPSVGPPTDPPPPPDCEEVNRHERCQEWKERGECTSKYKPYMEKYCRKSCYCKDEGIDGKEDTICRNKDEDCSLFGDMCKTNMLVFKNYVTANCKKTCGLCDKSSWRSGNGKVPSNICVDRRKNCKKFAEQGDCKKNVAYMTQLCPQACKVCGRSSSHSSCKDRNPACATAALKGDCITNKAYMKMTCAKSCKLC